MKVVPVTVGLDRLSIAPVGVDSCASTITIERSDCNIKIFRVIELHSASHCDSGHNADWVGCIAGDRYGFWRSNWGEKRYWMIVLFALCSLYRGRDFPNIDPLHVRCLTEQILQSHTLQMSHFSRTVRKFAAVLPFLYLIPLFSVLLCLLARWF